MKKRKTVWGGAIGAMALAGVVVPLPVGAPSAEAKTTEVRTCLSSDFKLIYEGREAAAGTQYLTFSMARIMGDGPGGESCMMRPPVAMHWVDELGGARVGDWGDYDPNPPEPFVVGPGGAAELVVRQPEPMNYPEGECDPQPVAGIQVYLEFEGDEGVYGPTGGDDVMCSQPGKAVPTAFVTPYEG